MWKRKDSTVLSQPFRIPVLIASHLESTFLRFGKPAASPCLRSSRLHRSHPRRQPRFRGITDFFFFIFLHPPPPCAVFLRIAARPLEKDYSFSTRCLKFRQLWAPRHFLLREEIVFRRRASETPRNSIYTPSIGAAPHRSDLCIAVWI